MIDFYFLLEAFLYFLFFYYNGKVALMSLKKFDLRKDYAFFQMLSDLSSMLSNQ